MEFVTANFTAGDETSAQYWLWLAWSVFSREASHNIKRLELDFEELTHLEIDIIKNVLQARNPLVYISPKSDNYERFPSAEQLDREPLIVDVRPKTSLLVRVDARTERLARIETSDQVESLRVLEDSSDNQYVCVVYPGMGVCWVDRDDIIERRPFSASSVRSAHGIQRLGLQIGDETPLPDLLRLVRLVGPSVHTLAIRSMGSHRNIPNFVLEELLAACPDLVGLELVQIDVADFKWLPKKGLHSILLDSVDVTQPGEYGRFLEDISSCRVDIRQLHIQNTQHLLNEIQEQMFTMLDSNHVLERLFIAFDTLDSDEEVELPTQTADLEKRHGTPLNVKKAPFPMRSRLAFVSAMGICLDETHGRLPELDAALIANIFEYTAPHQTRICGAIPFQESWSS